jgi:uncharacterized membrane protein YoaK (UPF0700 family)
MASAQGTSFDRGTLFLLSLSFAAGATDVLSFLGFGGVFTSAMTGNTALLAMAIGRGDVRAATHSLTALGGFVLGAFMGEFLVPPGEQAVARGTVGRLLMIELAAIAACAALWTATERAPGATLYPVILLSAIGMGVQAVAARLANSAGINTIVFTSVLIRIITTLADRLMARPRSSAAPIAPHLECFAAYALGGLLAGVLSLADASLLAWLPALAVIAALAALGRPG